MIDFERCSILNKSNISYSSGSIPKGQLMPQTKEYFMMIMERDAELILSQRDEINKLKQTINDLRQKNSKLTLNKESKL